MMANRKWWQISLGFSSPNSETYHYLVKETRSTACGFKLPEVYGRFYCLLHTPEEQKNLRCSACIEATKTMR